MVTVGTHGSARVRAAALTDRGCLHPDNQDRMLVDARGGVFVVADGVGGLADAGSTAQAVVDGLAGGARHVSAPAGPHARESVRAAVRAVVAEVNGWVRAASRYGPGNTGATAALLVLRADVAVVGHLGDCRVYLAHAGTLRRLTDDHALATGELTGFVGMAEPAVPDVSLHVLQPGDRLLLCTDGLPSGVTDGELDGQLDEGVGAVDDLSGACRRLVDRARRGGALDDITVVAVRYGGPHAGGERR